VLDGSDDDDEMKDLKNRMDALKKILQAEEDVGTEL